MSPGAKVFLTLAGVGAVIGGIVVFTAKKAKASTLPAAPQTTEGGEPPDVVVPDLPDVPEPLQPSGTVPPFVPPFPQFTPTGPAPAPTPLPLPFPAPVAQPATPPPVLTIPTPLGPVSVPSSLPTAPPPPATVPLPPIVPTPTGPVPLPPILTAPAPSSPIPIPLPVAVPAPAPTPVPVTTVSKETAAMVQALLIAETKKGWNTTNAQVGAWQKSRGLVVDNKFGPKSALAVAAELGTIPIIRFWPKGSIKDKALNDYRTALFEMAAQATDPARADQLRFAADRERAQAFGAKAAAAPPIASELQVSLAKVA